MRTKSNPTNAEAIAAEGHTIFLSGGVLMQTPAGKTTRVVRPSDAFFDPAELGFRPAEEAIALSEKLVAGKLAAKQVVRKATTGEVSNDNAAK